MVADGRGIRTLGKVEDADVAHVRLAGCLQVGNREVHCSWVFPHWAAVLAWFREIASVALVEVQHQSVSVLFQSNKDSSIGEIKSIKTVSVKLLWRKTYLTPVLCKLSLNR